jgi:hypothetical protein
LKSRFRTGLFRARLRLGRTAATFLEFGADHLTFVSLANLCAGEKSPEQLEALLAAYRKEQPDDPFALAWELDAHWLRGKYKRVVQMLTRDETGPFSRPRLRWKSNSYLVRGLVKTGRAAEAVRAAEAAGRRSYGDRLLLVLAHASTGDVKQTIAAMEKMDCESYFVLSCYRDEDLGPLLRSAPFEPFRVRFPEPKDESARK